MLKEALKHYGVTEIVGPKHNPTIMGWAKELGVSWYTSDEVPWCGLFVGIVASRCKYPFNKNKLLAAREWNTYGVKVDPKSVQLGDILVFSRTGGGHVGFYVGETDKLYAVLGGNQGNAVSVTWLSKDRLLGVRRPKYKIGAAGNPRRIFLKNDGEPVSTNEA